MSTVTVEEAQAKLPELIAKLVPGEDVVITQDDQPVARLVGQLVEKSQPLFGRGRGKLVIVSEDDEHLKDFAEYMP